MKFKVTVNFLYQLLFATCIMVTYLNIYELTFGVWFVAILLTLKKAYSATLIKYISCFAGIFLIAFIASFFYPHKTYDFIRDITYLVKPILGLLVGYQLCRAYNINPVKTIVYTGLAIAIAHLGVVVFSILKYRILNIHHIRSHAGYFSDFEVYALLLVIFNRKFHLRLSAQRKWMLIAIIGVSSLMYLARTNFLQFILIYMYLKGYFRLNPRSMRVMGSLIALVLISYSVIYNMNFSRNGKGLEALFYKIKNAPIEAFKTRINKDDYQDFNDNYRSFENITTMRQVSYEGPEAILFGKGLGATMDIGKKVWSNDGEYIRYVPILHNGFMTVFLKSGIAGVFLQLLFIYMLFRQFKTNDDLSRQVASLLKATAIFLVISNWVFLGLYLKLDNKSILIGFLLAFRQIIHNREVAESKPQINANN